MPALGMSFGEFELDADAFRLRRQGRPARLARVPMELMLLFVSRNADWVSRVEIIAKLWGKDAYIDTNTAIKVATSKVRQALRKDPDSPQFLRTVPGRGCRFIGSLERLAYATPAC